MKNLLICFTLLLCSCQSKMNDEQAIQQVLEKESATWRAGDFKGHSECWHIQPYSRILVSTPSGATFDVPPELMKDPNAKMGDGGSSQNSNYKMSIHGDYAWVSHEEVSTAKDGQKTYSHEVRMLEKVAGEWKLVGQSIHAYNP